MKTAAMLLLMSVFLFGVTGCAQEAEQEQTPEPPPAELTETAAVIPDFSYEEVQKHFPEGAPGVKTDGFRNVTTTPVLNATDAAERAKAECTVEYDTVRVRYDRTTDIWEVCFLAHHPGGGQDVYLNGDGMTQLIVYGE